MQRSGTDLTFDIQNQWIARTTEGRRNNRKIRVIRKINLAFEALCMILLIMDMMILTTFHNAGVPVFVYKMSSILQRENYGSFRLCYQ